MKLELFNAILSMDSYHRGYDQGIELTGIELGDTLVIAESNAQNTSDEVSTSFYAIAYDLGMDYSEAIINGTHYIYRME